MDIFKKASRKKFRFPSVKGDVTTEDLWDINLMSRDGFSLNEIAKTLNKMQKESAEESFVEPVKEVENIAAIKLDIVKAVISHKLTAIEIANKRAATIAKKQKLLEALEKKRDGALEDMEIGQIEQMLKEL